MHNFIIWQLNKQKYDAQIDLNININKTMISKIKMFFLLQDKHMKFNFNHGKQKGRQSKEIKL
jgi:hypothetical protein